MDRYFMAKHKDIHKQHDEDRTFLANNKFSRFRY